LVFKVFIIFKVKIISNGVIIFLYILKKYKTLDIIITEEAKQLEDEFYKRNRKAPKILIDKGFDRFTINMALSVWSDKDSEKE